MTIKNCIDIVLPVAFSALLLTAAQVSAESAGEPLKAAPAEAAPAPRPPAQNNPATTPKPQSSTAKPNAQELAQTEQLTRLNKTLDDLYTEVTGLKTSLSELTGQLKQTQRSSDEVKESSTLARDLGQHLFGVDIAVLLIALLIVPLLSWLTTRATLRSKGIL